MVATDLKSRVHEYVEGANEDVLLELHRILEKYYNEPNAELGGISINQYNEELDEAEAEIDRGEFYTQEEVEAMSKKWMEE